MSTSSPDAMQVAVAWFERGDYQAFRALLKHSLPPTYEAWERRTKTMLTRITRQGGIPVKVDVSPEAFVAWCGRQHRDASWISLQIYVDMT
ncbi:hypothetical protein [Burkholderia sp. AW49-1]